MSEDKRETIAFMHFHREASSRWPEMDTWQAAISSKPWNPNAYNPLVTYSIESYQCVGGTSYRANYFNTKTQKEQYIGCYPDVNHMMEICIRHYNTKALRYGWRLVNTDFYIVQGPAWPKKEVIK